MTELLSTLVLLGAWNAANLIVRAMSREWSWQYVPSVCFGAWAAVLLVMQ